MAFVPRVQDPQTVGVRPVNKGIVTATSPNQLPKGAFLDVRNFFARTIGLERRPGFATFGAAIDYPPIRDLVPYFKTNGEQSTIIIDSKFIYSVQLNSVVGIYDTYSTGTVSVSGTTLTGSGTAWDTNDIRNGDVVVLDADGSGDGPEEVEVDSVGGATSITIKTTPTGTYGAGTDYEIRRAFASGANDIVDVTWIQNKLLFTDGVRTIRSYDGTTFGEFSSSITEVVDTIVFHRDRLWGGRVTDGGTNDYRQRLIWTSVTDLTDFTPNGDDLSIDRPYRSGKLRKILPLGDFLVAYYEDGIDVYRPTNIGGNLLPLSPQTFDSGNVSLVGQRAVAQWNDGHFFVGKDDVYFLSNTFALQALESPVRDDLLANPETLWATYVVADPERERIAFGIPGSSGNIEKIWSFNTKSKAWSYNQVTSTFLAVQKIVQGITWDTIDTVMTTPTWDGMDQFGSWDAIDAGSTSDRFWAADSGLLKYLTEGATLDKGTTAIMAVLETGDFDFGSLDMDKTISRFALKLKEKPSAALAFTVEGSTDSGVTYRTLGTLNIPVDKTEGKVNFRLTGDVIRFKVTSNSNVMNYVIIEYSLAVRARGMQAIRALE